VKSSVVEVPGITASYEQWMKEVDDWVWEFRSVSAYDLPDCAFRLWFEDGVSAREAAERAIEAALE